MGWHTVQYATSELYLHDRDWDLFALFFTPQLAVGIGTTLATFAIAAPMLSPAATKLRGVAVVGGGLTAIAVGLEWLSFQAATEGLAVPLMLVVAGALHLLASGLVADATGAIGRTFVPVDLPVATAMAT